MNSLDSVLLLVSIAAVPVVAILTARYAIWAQDRDLSRSRTARDQIRRP